MRIEDEVFERNQEQIADLESRLAVAVKQETETKQLLIDCRKFAFNAVRAGVDLEGFDPSQHVLIKKIDEALADYDKPKEPKP